MEVGFFYFRIFDSKFGFKNIKSMWKY
jgi:hypothetical protein